MNNEIKEILINNIKNEIKKTKEKDFALCIEQWEQLLDYITNLQEKIDKAIEYIKHYGNLYCLKHTQFKNYTQYKKILDILKGEDNE